MIAGGGLWIVWALPVPWSRPIVDPLIPDADPLLVLAVVVVAGLAFGALARRLGMAGVTGQIVAGIILGDSVLHAFSHVDVARLQPVTHFALGLIAVTVGGHLNLRRLRNAHTRLGLLLLAEVTITPLVVYGATVYLAGASWRVGLLLAALAISTAPATIVALVHETRSRGVFTKTLVGAVALNNIACIALFEAAHRAASVGLDGLGTPSASEYVIGPLKEILATGLLGAAAGGALVLATRHVFSSEKLATGSVITVLLASGVADALGLSPMLACLFLGVTLANLTPDKDEIVESAFVNVRDAIFAVFFTLAGAHLDFGQLRVAGGLVAAVVLARMFGKIIAARLALTVAKATESVRKHLGAALVPQAGVAVGLLLFIQDDPALESIAPTLLAIGLTTVAINEIIGPILGRRALMKSGDAGQDRARLIDFLHEENIVTDLRAQTKEEAITQLVGVLIRSNRLEADRDELLASVLERERDMSTCFGDGLAVPHGILENGVAMVGAMGISSVGLPFETPDGVPVHCMVVLATPDNERDRHLQVLAALARLVTSDRTIQRQLYHAESPGHAYELLHAGEGSTFNVFLDDDE